MKLEIYTHLMNEDLKRNKNVAVLKLKITIYKTHFSVYSNNAPYAN